MLQTYPPPASRVGSCPRSGRQLPLLYESEAAAEEVAQGPDCDYPASRLEGLYEVLLPGWGGQILFVNTLEEAAQLLTCAWKQGPDEGTQASFLHFLQRAATSLRPGEYGVRLHRPGPDRQSWIAKVRASQERPAPRFQVDDYVVQCRSEGEVPRRQRVWSIKVINHPDPCRQYLYSVGSSGVTLVRQRHLLAAPVSAK